MGDYLRDKRLTFLTIDHAQLLELNQELHAILGRANQVAGANQAVISYVLRYDGMGIIRKNFEEIERPFNRAKNVERVVFQFYSDEHDISKGKRIQIYLDARDLQNCFLVVSDDDEEWVDSIFSRIMNLLLKQKNGNWLAHSSGVELLIQLVGVLCGFFLCIIVANAAAPSFNARYSFFIVFIGLFLIFSNLWTYLLILIGKARTHFWPYISFKKEPIGIIGQAVIGFILTLILSGLVGIGVRILRAAGDSIAK